MPIVGFNFTKLKAERKNPIEKDTKLNISAKIGIKDIKEEKLPTGKNKANGLRFDFEYSINYTPEIADLEIEGFIYFLDDSDVVDGITKEWKKKKDVPLKIKQLILNTVVLKATIKALTLEQEINLPPHIPFPSVKPVGNKEDYIG